MKNLRSTIVIAVICSLFLSTTVHAEAVSDKASAISPKHIPGAGEFVHGQGYGKLLMRILVLGAVPVQGIHYVPEGTDVLFALLYAGGKGDFARFDGVTIRRRGEKDLMDVDLDELIEDGSPIPKLVDGDVVTVPFNWKKDLQSVLTVTGLVASITSLALAILALKRSSSTP